jgi:hypothetical protein
MTTVTNSHSQWDFDDLLRETAGKLSERKLTRDQSKSLIEDFLRRLPNGEILTNGYYLGFKQTT